MSGPSIVQDFAAIAANLASLEAEKKPRVIEDQSVKDIDTVYGMYCAQYDTAPSEMP
jgi:hypothetical protein